MPRTHLAIPTMLGMLALLPLAGDEPKAPAAAAAQTPVAAPAPPPQPPPMPLTVGPYRGAEIGAYGILVPITKDQREKGLKYVKAIPDGRGMVIFYKDKSPALFDTRDYLVKVDLVFIGVDGKIQKVIAAEPAPAGTKDADLAPYTVKGRVPAADVAKTTPDLPHTRFVVALAEGEGEKFSKAWKPKMVDRFVKADPNHRVWGFSNR